MKSEVILQAVALCLCAAGAGCSRSSASLENAPRPVKVQAVQEPNAEGVVRYSANIEPDVQVVLAAKVGGYVQEILQVRGADGRMRNLQGGDPVVPGMVLARIRDTDYREQVNQARSALVSAEATLEKATQDFIRAQRLYESQSLTKPDFDAAKAGHDANAGQVEAARAQLALAQIALEDCALKAPFGSVVLERSIEVGSLVAAGTAAFTLADSSSVKAVFGVPDTIVRRARLGMRLPVTSESFGAATFWGQVTAISPNADPASRVFQVEVTIPNPRDLLKPGMIATVAIRDDGDASRASAGRMLAVPLSSVVRGASSEEFAVFVVGTENGKSVARRRAIKIGEVYGNMIAVLEGLTLQEQVIVTGASLISDGEPVQIIP
jgi:multidrug efflux system membrane fusion protein